MPGVVDWIFDPLQVLDDALASSSLSDHKEQLQSLLHAAILEDRQRVPSLNNVPLHKIHKDGLVQFRCMVQDMFGPEYYLDTYETKLSTGQTRIRCGRYRDIDRRLETEEIIESSPHNKTQERHIFYCVPVPGESSWIKEQQQCDSACVASSVQLSCQTANQSSKRPLDEQDLAETSETGEAASSLAAKRLCKEDALEDSAHVHTPLAADFNFPLPGESGPAVIVKIYENAEAVKLNDIVHVFGVISTDPALTPHDQEDSMLTEEEQRAHHPPASLVPRLHAVLMATPLSINPLLVDADNRQPNIDSLLKDVVELRDNIKSILEQALCGDGLAAEYLLCHLLSSVYSRKDNVALGKMSLNLARCSSGTAFPPKLHALLRQLIVSSFFLPLTLENMNKMRFVPTKDYAANRLTSGLLQLSDRCHLVLDETAMQPGQLNETGLNNLTALGHIIRWQKLSYDFKYHQQEFDANIPVLVLSEGKSILPCDVLVPLDIQTDLRLDDRYRAIEMFLSPELLNKIRLYITVLPWIEYQLNEDTQRMVQEDFVTTRQQNKEDMTVDDFNVLLVLSRLLAMSYGVSQLTSDIWNKAKFLESERKLRLPKEPYVP